MVPQIEVFGEETHQFVAGSVVSNHRRFWAHVRQHDVEQFPTLTSSLYAGVDEKVKYGERFHFDHLATSTSHEQLFITNFEEADASIALCFDK